jgi:HEAT repeats
VTRKILLFAFLSMCAAFSASAQDEIELQFSLSKDHILLGEPVWIVATARNRSKHPTAVNMGSRCWELPISIEVAGAEPGTGERQVCSYGFVGSCMSSPPPRLAPGEVLTKRYLLQESLQRSALHLESAGDYAVRILKEVQYGSPAEAEGTFQDPTPYTVVRSDELELTILPPDAKSLADLEQNLAKTLGPGTTRDWKELEEVRETAKGLAMSPSPEMEPIFRAWLQTKDSAFRSLAVAGLQRIGSKEAKDDLAKCASAEGDPLQQAAIFALTDIGDSSYLPLFEKLAYSDDQGTRYGAIRALGVLGGENEIPVLLSLLANPHPYDRQNAIMALGFVQSSQAIPVLLGVLRGSSEDAHAADSALTNLTHHRVSLGESSEPAALAAAWQSWWFPHREGARVYGPYDCMTADDWRR